VKFAIWNFTQLIQNVGTSTKERHRFQIEIKAKKLINQEGTMQIVMP